jgi:DEAD/DEAH box helicase domain-containing protein
MMAGEGVVKRKRTSSSSDAPRKGRGKLGPPEDDENTRSNSSEVSSSYPVWPEDFLLLMRVFQSLNTVFTFCCTRKQFPTTFENLKTSVENLTGR